MKKVVLFVAVLLLAGFVSLSAAEPAFDPSISLSGEASFTFGINLLDGEQATGIANANSSDLTLTLIAADSNEKGGAEGEEVYGWIKLKTFKVVLDDDKSVDPDEGTWTGDTAITGSADGIEAKLFLGPVYVNILGLGDDDNIDKAGQISGFLVGNAYAGVGVAQVAEYNGIAIGLKDESIVSVIVGVSSLADWTTDGGTNAINTDNVYNFYFGVGLKAVENLTFDVAANLSTGDGTSVGLGAKAGYKIGLAEGISIEPTVGLDIELADGSTPMQLTGILNLDLPGADKENSDIFGNDEDDFATGLKFVFTTDLADSAQSDLGIYLFDGDLIPVLDIVGVVELSDLGDATLAETGIGVYASASIDVVAPWAKFYTNSVTGAANSTYTIIGVGVDLTVITNTTFSIGYSNESAAGTTNKHVLTFTTKIAY